MNSLSTKTLDIPDAMNQLPQITSLYKDVFAAPPWNEAYRCTCCDQSFGQETDPNTLCCDQQIVEYYPLATTQEEIGQYLGLTRSRLTLAVDQNPETEGIIGFAWGWEDTFDGANASKFCLEAKDCDMLCALTGITPADPFFYLSELGVRQDYRGKGLGRKLYQTLLESRDTNQSSRIMMRTSKQSPAFSISQSDQSFPLEVIYEYRDELDRVILFRE